MRGSGIIAPATLALALLTLRTEAAEPGKHTAAQAKAGAQVYASHCALCHGARMQGASAPALKGEAFRRSLGTDHLTAPQLFEFITSHMPRAEPGLLTDQQYLQAFAYLLAENGHPAGDRPLTKATLGEVRLLPPH